MINLNVKAAFIPTFRDTDAITGFFTYPVREIDEDGETVTEQCEEINAEAHGVYARMADTSSEWLADFENKKYAIAFTNLLQSIYRAGANYGDERRKREMKKIR